MSYKFDIGQKVCSFTYVPNKYMRTYSGVILDRGTTSKGRKYYTILRDDSGDTNQRLEESISSTIYKRRVL